MTSQSAQEVEIRPFVNEDAENARQVIVRCLAILNSADYDPEVLRAIEAEYSHSAIVQLGVEREIFIAEVGDHLIGTVCRDGNRLSMMFVDPDMNGKGVGRELLETVEEKAKAAGFSEVILNASITAHGFYERLGYRDTGETIAGPTGLNYCMVKTLKTA